MLHRTDWDGCGKQVLPEYLVKTYRWAYLTPRNMRVLDSHVVVNAILWGNYRRLQRAAISEFQAGDRVLQPACVYGDFSARLAEQLGPTGELLLRDISGLQLDNCRRKFSGMANITLRQADAAARENEVLDGVCCFFLLHEVPDDYKYLVVDGLLSRVKPGGKAVFVDYHQSHPWHPARPIMAGIFKYLEPYAPGLCRREIPDFAAEAGHFRWRKDTYFGGLYQKVVAERAA
ncbi:MAG: rhodoquinone biosynthesis methyltransferase RquA [Magnetospiraceae bacterium]